MALLPASAKPMWVIDLGQSRVRIDAESHWMETVFLDGSRCIATPLDTDAYREQAEALGYGADTWRYCVEHELFHTWVSLKMGRPRSIMLWDTAHTGGRGWPPGGREEEQYVTGFQRWLNTGEADEHTHEFLTMCLDMWGLDSFAVREAAEVMLDGGSEA
jgi:hypothetical protein